MTTIAIIGDVQPLVAATMVTVKGTLTDSTGATWNTATIIVQFIPGFGTPAGKYTWNGASFVQRQTLTASSGNFTVQLPANNDIIPIDSMWQLTISGNPQTPAVILTKYLDSSVATLFDISSQFHSIAPPLNTGSGGGGGGGPASQIIQAPDQATALSLSTANPNNIYFWI